MALSQSEIPDNQAANNMVSLKYQYGEVFKKCELLSGSGYWVFNPKTLANYVSENFSSLFKIESGKSEIDLDLLVSKIHLKNRSQVKKALANLISDRVCFQLECRLDEFSKEIRYIILEGKPDHHNNIYNDCLIIECKDITSARKDYDKSLKKPDSSELKNKFSFSNQALEESVDEPSIKELNQKLIKGQELSKTGYWETNLKTKMLFWSDEMYKIWDIERKDSKIDFDFFLSSIHPDDRKDFLYHRNRALSTEKELDVVYRIVTQEGNVKYIHELGEISRDQDNQYDIFRGTAQEITKEKEYEIKLTQRNFLIEAIMENIPMGVAVNKISDGETIYLNKAFEDVYGWPKEVLSDEQSFFENVFPNPEYRAWIREQISRDIQSGDPGKMNWDSILITTKAGEEKVINTKNILVPDLNLMISTASNDTERFWAEQAIKVSNERFRLVSEAVSDAVWDWDIKKNTIFWGRGYHLLFGYPESQIQVGENAWFESVHPEDYPRIWESILKARKDPKMRYWSAEYRFKRYDGTYAFVSEKTVIIRDRDGKPIRMVGALQDITQAKEKENHLLLLESVVTNSKDAVLITKADPTKAGYEIIYSNKAFEDMTGYTSNEVLGKAPKILQGKDSDRKVLKQFGEDLRNWKNSSIEVLNYTKQGKPFWVNVNVVPVADNSGRYTHWVGIQRDITENKKYQQELELINERFKLISESTNDAIYDWDIQTGERFWGDGFSKLFGIELQKSKDFGEEWRKRIHPDDHSRVKQFFNNLFVKRNNDGRFGIEYRVKKSTGEYCYVFESGVLKRNADRKPIRMTGAVQNIDDRKEYEKSLQELNESLEKINRELAHSNKELEQFAYVASHDLQEPLRMITSFLGLIEKRYSTVLDEKGRKYIHFAIDGAKRMRQIILDLHEFSKLDNFQEVKSWIDSSELIQKSQLYVKKQLWSKTPVFHLGALPEIYGHQSTLIQLFQNLISNAIKYQPLGQKAEIWISATEQDDFWQFAIRDNGIGIEEEYRDKIFVIFQRLHTSDEYSGTGIGLAICKKIVEFHQGKIWVESNQGVGSTFHFTIRKPTL